MNLITLTTDLGHSGFYTGAVKGALYRAAPDVHVVDITHHIPAHAIHEAAFILKNCYADFPEGTIHLLSINDLAGKAPQFLLAQHDKQYFLAPDNGVLSLIFDDKPKVVYTINKMFVPQPLTFPAKEVMVPVAARLVKGEAPKKLGTPTDDYTEKTMLQPVIREGFIQGAIIHFDHYDNAIINITRDLFEQVGKGRPCRIYVARKESVNGIAESYDAVPEGELVCLFGHMGYLEVGINRGSVKNLLGLQLRGSVEIEFV